LFTCCKFFLNFCKKPDSYWYYRRLNWQIVHQVYSNAISYLSICDHSGREKRNVLTEENSVETTARFGKCFLLRLCLLL
jgi:hypothetical protein